jgi:glycosyltransferase involved in cell wall biosynthesis
MRVLILATDIFTRGGIARYTSTLASSLGNLLGPENVDVLCFWDWGHQGETPTDYRLLGTVSSRSRAGVLSRLRFLTKAARAGSSGYDLVIANHVALAPVAALLKLAFGTPYWVACHCIEIWWGTTRPRRAALKNADLILPVSRYTAEIVQHMPGIDSARVRVLYNAIPDALTQELSNAKTPAPAKEAGMGHGHKSHIVGCRPMLLSVCALVRGNEFKGIDTMIEALPRVLKTVPDLQYVVVGEGEIRPKLEAFAAKAGVAAKVRFVGAVSDSELIELYRQCDLFVLPSRGQECRGTIGGEGFGRVYVEAALAGKPVIGSCAGGAAEAVLDGETGLLVDPVSVEEVAEAVLAVLSDRLRAAAMGAAGRNWALATFTQQALKESLQPLLQPYGLQSAPLCELEHAGGQL